MKKMTIFCAAVVFAAHAIAAARPVVFYGGCDAGPADACGNLVGRMLDVPIVCMRSAGTDLMSCADADAAARTNGVAYVVMTPGGMPEKEFSEKYASFVRRLGTLRVETPIFICESLREGPEGTSGGRDFVRKFIDRMYAENPGKWCWLIRICRDDLLPGGLPPGGLPDECASRAMARCLADAIWGAQVEGVKRRGPEPFRPFAAEIEAYMDSTDDEAQPPVLASPCAAGLHGRYCGPVRIHADNAAGDESAKTWKAAAWRGERVHGQFVLWDGKGSKGMTLSCSPLVSADGATIPADRVTMRHVRFVLGWGRTYGNARLNRLGESFGDCLDDSTEFDIPAGGYRPVWLTVDVPRDACPGTYKGVFSVIALGGARVDFHVEIEVLAATLPERNGFFLDFWQQPWKIARHHGVKPFSDIHYRLLEPHYRELARAGQKVVTTWITDGIWGFAPGSPRTMVGYRKDASGRCSFDFSLFDEYVEFARKCGIGPQIHCYTPVHWGGHKGECRYVDSASGETKSVACVPGDTAWREYWRPLLVALEKHAREKGWLGDVYLAMDEVPVECSEMAARFIAETAPGLKLAMAADRLPSGYGKAVFANYSEALQGKAFLSREMEEEIPRRKAAGMTTTFYICCWPVRPNTFFHSPPAEQLWPGLYAALKGYDGLLRWSTHLWPRDPFLGEILQRRGWAVPGDYFIMYPGAKASVRWEYLRDSIEDWNKIAVLRGSGCAVDSLDVALAEIDFPKVKDLDESAMKERIDKVLREIDALARQIGAEENLSTIRPSPRVSWMKEREEPSEKGVDSFRLKLSPEKRAAGQSFMGGLFPAYTASGRVRISFRYRSSAHVTYCSASLARTMEKPLPGVDFKPYVVKSLGPAKEWRNAVWEFDCPPLDCWGWSIGFTIEGKEGTAEVEGVRIEEVPPKRMRGRPLTIGGVRAEEIAVLAIGDRARHLEELRAARMLRYAIYVNGGDYLPVRTVKDVSSCSANAVLVGRAAEEAGFFTDAELGRMRAEKGSCLARQRGARLGITGAFPAGIAYGAFACLREMGIEFLGGTQWRRPAGDSFAVRDGFFLRLVPAIPFRTTSDGGRMGRMVELRGRYSGGLTADYSCGARKGQVTGDHSMPRAIVTTDEFADSHPEFFALQANGRRHGKGTNPWALQYCLSNPELADVTGRRIVEMMRVNPGAIYFPVAPGDGGNSFCKCERCQKAGSVSDVWITFANRVAAITKKEFPDKYISTYSYVDTPEPPVSGVKPDENVSCSYCVYPTAYWPNGMIWDVPENARGFKALADWRRLFPRLALVLYPMQCGEWMNFWPGFNFDVAAVRDFASHHAESTRYFGLFPVHGRSIPQAGAFADLRIYVLGRIEEDSSYDALAGAYAFIRDFYGAAAPQMREYFDIARAEPARRGWGQSCEQHLKGFVTKEFASRVLPILDAAQKAALDDPARLAAVLHEKQIFLWSYLTDICPGRGNVLSGELEAWAGRMAEFCRLSRDTEVKYMGSFYPPRKWFWETAFLDVDCGVDDDWTKNAAVKAVMDDPMKTLGRKPPTYQKNVEGGCEIPGRGIFGGAREKATLAGRSEKSEIIVLRRPTSGLGVAFTRLRLGETPKGATRLSVMGMDNDKKVAAKMSLAVNGKVVYKGAVPWKHRKWSEESFEIPAGILHKGENDIVFENTTPDMEKDGEGGDRFRATRDYFWGWYIVERLRFIGVEG
ncbi:MAG: DUF4838 domain-containing protein [Kiritimatiellae bacterium]|nr:DUF4838 domain-containing protein [Kiritimatiellia bacterium]